MTLNIPNLDKLIAHLEAQPPERINMSNYSDGELKDHACGTCGCIAGWTLFIRDGQFNSLMFDGSEMSEAGEHLGLGDRDEYSLFFPAEYGHRERYPAHRVIATLKRLRDRFLATGEIVVDWGAEPGQEPAQPWTAPQAVEITEPVLPDEITRLLGVVTVEA